jgi:hypothetical protein
LVASFLAPVLYAKAVDFDYPDDDGSAIVELT